MPVLGRFEESLHPRGGKGSAQGGRFVKKGDTGSALVRSARAARSLIQGVLSVFEPRWYKFDDADAVTVKDSLTHFLDKASEMNAELRRATPVGVSRNAVVEHTLDDMKLIFNKAANEVSVDHLTMFRKVSPQFATLLTDGSSYVDHGYTSLTGDVGTVDDTVMQVNVARGVKVIAVSDGELLLNRDTKFTVTGREGNIIHVTASAEAEATAPEKATGKTEIGHFVDAGIELGRFAATKEGRDKFLKDWNERIGVSPAEFKKSFMGGLEGTMRIGDLNGQRWIIGGYIMDGGRRIANYDRGISWDEKTASSDLFQITDAQTGKGVGKDFLAGNVAEYQRLGLKQLKVHANIDVGGYAWAKYGYVPNSNDWEILRETIREQVDSRDTGSSLTPMTWRSYSDGDRESAVDAWMEVTYDGYIDSAVENWRDGGGAQADAARKIVEDFGDGDTDWATTAIDSAIADKGLNFDAAKLIESDTLSLDFNSNTEKLVPMWDANEFQVPAEVRTQIERTLQDAFGLKIDEVAQDMEPPEEVTSIASERQYEDWNDMSERAQVQWALDQGVMSKDDAGGARGNGASVSAAEDEKAAILKLTESNDPKSLWAIADSSLGKQLLLNSDWYGSLNFSDAEAMQRFNAYVAKSDKKMRQAA
jgi:hypothetical protein